MMYYLDTNIILYSVKGTFTAIKDHFRKIPMQSIVIPDVVMAEIEYGAQKSQNYDNTIRIYTKFTDNFAKAEFDTKSAKVYGEIRSRLEKSGTPIGANDMLIAAIAMSNGGTLVTHNTREFSRIQGLLVEDWTI